jgi:DNA repair exonuclease SbcCD ATPase subunit
MNPLAGIAVKVFKGMIDQYKENELADERAKNERLEDRVDLLEARVARRDATITKAKLAVEENALAFDELEKRLETSQNHSEYLEDELALARGEIAKLKARGAGAKYAEEPESNPFVLDSINCDICGDEFDLAESDSGVLCPDCEAPE